MCRFWPPLLHFWPPFSKGYNFQYNHVKQKKVDYFIDLDQSYPSIKTKIWKINDLKTVIAKMATINTVVTNDASTLNVKFFENFSIKIVKDI